MVRLMLLLYGGALRHSLYDGFGRNIWWCFSMGGLFGCDIHWIDVVLSITSVEQHFFFILIRLELSGYVRQYRGMESN
jgi:hypothetical protein